MNRFTTVRDAKEYLISRILAQADRDGVRLSDVEREMLYFSETGWTLPNMMAVSREFDQKYSQDEYENKIGRIIRRIRNQPENKRDGGWDAAIERLRSEDHYLLVLIAGASSGNVKLSRWEVVRLIVAAAVCVAVFLPIVFFVESHVDNRAVSKLILEGALLALVVLAALAGSRGRRGSG